MIVAGQFIFFSRGERGVGFGRGGERMEGEEISWLVIELLAG